jgi:hypothetical protein
LPPTRRVAVAAPVGQPGNAIPDALQIGPHCNGLWLLGINVEVTKQGCTHLQFLTLRRRKGHFAKSVVKPAHRRFEGVLGFSLPIAIATNPAGNRASERRTF